MLRMKKKIKSILTENFDFLTELNEQQKKAVLCEDKRICVIAGPGCGKTKTLISRALYLLKSQKVPAEQILLLTFSKKAIREIENRITSSLGTSWFGSNPTIANLHSFCYQFLRKHSSQLGFIGNSFPLYDRKDQEDLVKKILADKNFSLSTDSKEINTIVRLISLSKVIDDNNFTLFTDWRKLLAQEYQKYLQTNKALDFNDLLLMTIKILERFPKIRSEYQIKFTNVLVDEFQDINQIQ
jgi:DNA helicase-2/ATP-dependent DNA helicase PcrA